MLLTQNYNVHTYNILTPPKSCVFLPSEWFIIAISSLSILSVLVVIAIIAAILLCYLRLPEKTPAALVRTLHFRKMGTFQVMQTCTLWKAEPKFVKNLGRKGNHNVCRN